MEKYERSRKGTGRLTHSRGSTYTIQAQSQLNMQKVCVSSKKEKKHGWPVSSLVLPALHLTLLSLFFSRPFFDANYSELFRVSSMYLLNVSFFVFSPPPPPPPLRWRQGRACTPWRDPCPSRCVCRGQDKAGS